MTTHVLIAVDGSEAAPEVVGGAHRAFGDDADYTIVSVGSTAPYTAAVTPFAVQPALIWVLDPYLNGSVDAATHAAETAAASDDLATTEHPVEIITGTGSPGPAICDVATERKADVVVVGSLERGWLSRIVIPSVSEYVVKHAPCDVLVVRTSQDD